MNFHWVLYKACHIIQIILILSSYTHVYENNSKFKLMILRSFRNPYGLESNLEKGIRLNHMGQ